MLEALGWLVASGARRSGKSQRNWEVLQMPGRSGEWFGIPT